MTIIVVSISNHDDNVLIWGGTQRTDACSISFHLQFELHVLIDLSYIFVIHRNNYGYLIQRIRSVITYCGIDRNQHQTNHIKFNNLSDPL